MNFRGSISQKEEPSLLFSEESNVFSLPEGQSGYEEAKRLLEASQIDINKLHGRIEELETDLEASNADVSKLKNKYTVKFHEVEATRQNVCELEVQLQAYSTDIELLRKENRILVKESSEMNARLEKEVKNIERLRSEWSSREGNLLEQLRQQRQENKTLRAQTARLEKELELAINSDAAAGNEEIEELKTELKKSEKKAHLASLELTEAQRVVRDLESRLTSELTTSERLREENQELSQLNSSLMEDAENYRQMYEEQNMMLDEMNAGGDLEVNEILRFGERWDEESSKEVEEDAEEEVLEEVEEIDEMAVIGDALRKSL
ncbi:hypothetical protein BC829DRAFT_268519 [Chytridium lagenaria]|nr:hypothetical protein BC829DRAFT_268519 [Chytridium lagenaria]